MTDKERLSAFLDGVDRMINIRVQEAVDRITEDPGIYMGAVPCVDDVKKEILEMYFPDTSGEDF